MCCCVCLSLFVLVCVVGVVVCCCSLYVLSLLFVCDCLLCLFVGGACVSACVC